MYNLNDPSLTKNSFVLLILKYFYCFFRYSGGPAAKEETRTADGITRGSYSYIDGHGITQFANYISDPVNGFRVAATNLPVGPSAPAGPSAPVLAVGPAPVAVAAPITPLETPEVRGQIFLSLANH